MEEIKMGKFKGVTFDRGKYIVRMVNKNTK